MGSGERKPFENKTIEWIDSRLPIFTIMNKEYGVFPTPRILIISGISVLSLW